MTFWPPEGAGGRSPRSALHASGSVKCRCGRRLPLMKYKYFTCLTKNDTILSKLGDVQVSISAVVSHRDEKSMNWGFCCTVNCVSIYYAALKNTRPVKEKLRKKHAGAEMRPCKILKIADTAHCRWMKSNSKSIWSLLIHLKATQTHHIVWIYWSKKLKWEFWRPPSYAGYLELAGIICGECLMWLYSLTNSIIPKLVPKKFRGNK